MAASTGAGLISKDGGQGKSSGNYPTGFEVPSVVRNYASTEITKKWLLNDGNEVTADDGMMKNNIEMVPPVLREPESNKKCFDPVMVSIGPYHHGKPCLRAAEKFKSSLTRMFLDKCASKSDSAALLDMYMVAFEAKECYDEATVQSLDSKTFAKMMRWLLHSPIH